MVFLRDDLICLRMIFNDVAQFTMYENISVQITFPSDIIGSATGRIVENYTYDFRFKQLIQVQVDKSHKKYI